MFHFVSAFVYLCDNSQAEGTSDLTASSASEANNLI